jgi:puromycin-sensitive aminopeptidase
VWAAIEFRYNISQQTVEIFFDDFPGWKKDGSYKINILFSGILNDQMRGLYRSTYLGLDGQSHTMATTQFEATDARRAFPCFDEPSHKATFQLVVTIPAHMQCISNTPPESIHTSVAPAHNSKDKDNNMLLKTITYQKTPKMSTYLLALVVGEFDAVSTTSPTTSIQTTVYTIPGKAHQGTFCLDTATKCLDLYQDLFHIPYPLIKSDLLAIPDFAAGAMENWGCVTYREAKILVKEGSTSESMRRGIARTVCHELAHQWFGNLVTMEFWTQLWLNEGFARFMEFVAIDILFPDWDAWTEFVQSVFGVAQSLDAMKSSHPVEVEVQHPDEIHDIFDAISYAKGASLIRMLSSYLGFETFMEGLKIYLQRHAYGNATTDMLWQALQDASNKPVAQLMNPWTLQTGYPLLRLNDTGTLDITRFLASGPGSDVTESSWPIPVTAIVQGEEQVQGPWIIHGPDGDQSVDLLEAISTWSAAGKWFKLNANQTAFIRVAYTSEQWQRLASAMVPAGTQLSAIDRLGLISDSFAAGRAGYSSIVDSLRLVEDFGQHDTAEYSVWEELSENLSDLCRLYRAQDYFPKFQAYIAKIYSKQLEILGWDAKDGESQRTGTLRASVINMMGKAGDRGVLAEAFRRFSEYEKSGLSIPGDLQEVVFRLALRHDEAHVYLSLKRIYEASTFSRRTAQLPYGYGYGARHVTPRGDARVCLVLRKSSPSGRCLPLGSLSSASEDGGRACWEAFKSQYERFNIKFAGGPMWGACVGLSCPWPENSRRRR